MLVALVVAAAVAGGYGAARAFEASCSLSSLRPIPIGQTSFIYAADGSLLGSIPAQRHRQPVRLSAISHWMRTATVSVEDRRFYSNGAYDLQGILRAAWADLTERRVVQGGSTLEQQLVRNLYIGTGGHSFRRKA